MLRQPLLTVVLLVASSLAFAQHQFGAPPKYLGDCQTRVVKWQDWYNRNINEYNDRYDKLMQDFSTERLRNKDLQEDLASLREDSFFGGLGIGCGAFLVFIALRWVKQLKRLSPISPAKRQLTVMILAATWITVAGFVAQQQPQLTMHPVNMAFTVGVYSLPALLFGGIAVWWFGKAKQA